MQISIYLEMMDLIDSCLNEYKAKTIHDRRKKKGDPLLLKRFRDYYNDKGIM